MLTKLAAERLMTAGRNPLIGRWRITSMELWDTDFIDMLEPGFIRFDAGGSGEFAFGAVHGELDGRYGPASVHFTWEGNDEMDPASGDGDARLEDDGTLTGEIRFHLGDTSSFTARRR
jgi:hypothetical protein